MNTKRDKNQQIQRNLHMGYPYIIGYMSVDVHREYHHNLSQLKYLTSIPKGMIFYNLNHNIENAVKRTTDENNEKISLMLKFLLDQRYRLDFLIEPTDTTFITYRRTLISVMTSVYTREPISIVASLLKKGIYLCSVNTAQDLQNHNPTAQNAKFCAWGYKFEQYMLSDIPCMQPNVKKPVVENEEFSMYYSSQLGKHRLFYGAQIDGMLATRTAPGPPNTDDVNINLGYLRSNKFVELKTNREIHNKRQEQNFKRYKMIRCWCQCYLAGLKGLLVGYRNDDGIIQRVQWFDTEDIVKYCGDEWNPQVAIDYLVYFLNYVENCFKSLKDTPGDLFASKEPLTLKFDIDNQQKITVTKDIYREHVILPDWYVYKMQAHL
ncbi:decapping nuclease DXO homolog [Spodoptera litura]|uniref:Decapping nuclease n=1 Tax=Spodoptera litura TaxID=69820 RepID=A0A9J7ISL6_SPOLT|nr:decapping nuclease DXO homolog [Spodoptera litura]